MPGDIGALVLAIERIIGSLGSSIDIRSGDGGFKDFFDEQCSLDLTIQVEDLSAKSRKSDGPDFGVESSIEMLGAAVVRLVLRSHREQTIWM